VANASAYDALVAFCYAFYLNKPTRKAVLVRSLDRVDIVCNADVVHQAVVAQIANACKSERRWQIGAYFQSVNAGIDTKKRIEKTDRNKTALWKLAFNPCPIRTPPTILLA
jgi:hypothetical protein